MSAEAAMGGGSGVARDLWRALETLHMTVYWAPEPRDAYRRAGLRGGWMGYFASRSAAMGPVPAGVVMATFYNFHPRMVRRAIPDAWGFASPAEVLAARSGGVDAALREYRGWSDEEWSAALGRLRDRGWVEANGSLTEAGRVARDAREHRTDDLAMAPWRHLGEDGRARLLDLLGRPVRLIVAGGGVPFPNPVGLPATDSRRC